MPYLQTRNPSSSYGTNKTIVTTFPMYKSTTLTPTEIVTLQYDDSPVFVKRPETYQGAIDAAKKEFYQLAHLPSHRIGFALNDVAHGDRQVRISEGAWVAISAKIPGGTIINVLVLPDPDEKFPPLYGSLEVPIVPPKGNRFLGIRKVASSASMHPSSKPSGGLFPWIGVGK